MTRRSISRSWSKAWARSSRGSGYYLDVTSNATTRPPPTLSLITSEWVIASDAYIADEHGEAVVVIHSDATHLNRPLIAADIAMLTETSVPRRRGRSRTALVSKFIAQRLGVQMLRDCCTDR